MNDEELKEAMDSIKVFTEQDKDREFWQEIMDRSEEQISDFKKALKFQNAVNEMAHLNLEKLEEDGKYAGDNDADTAD